MGPKKNIFISHFKEDDAHVQSLKARLRDQGYNVRNFSVDSTKHKDGRRPTDAVIKRHLDMQIRRASTVICLIGPETHTRPWVNYEIRRAHVWGKQIVGFYTYGNAHSAELPVAFKRYGGPTMGWNSIEKLGDTIENKTMVVNNPDGTPRTPTYSITRVKCV